MCDEDTCEFDVDMVIDLFTPPPLDPAARMSGETILQVCAAIAGAVKVQLAVRMDIVWSHGFAGGPREHKAISEALKRIANRGDAKVHRFEVPPHEPNAAEMAPDATLLPPQADQDLRILVWLRAVARVGSGSRGQALFRAASKLESLASGFSDQHATVLRIDIQPAGDRDRATMLQFMDSCVR